MALTKVQTIGIETGISLTGVTTVTTLNASTDTLSVGGTVNFGGNVSIAGTLTYEDVTNIDSVGIITARSAIVLSDDNAIHFRGVVTDDADAILRASAGGGQLLINSRNDTIINIDSNNDSSDAHFAVAHGAATGSSTELFRVQEDGSIGVNTDNPLTTFHVARGSDDNSILYVTGADASSEFVALGVGDGYGMLTAGGSGSTSTNLIIRTASSGTEAERMRIDSSGRLLLGTTTEGAADADNLTIADSANCGITIRSGTSNAGAIYFSDATSGTGEYDGYINYNQSSRFLSFATATAEAMRVTSSGQLLIGTTTSKEGASKLQCVSDSDTTIYVGSTDVSASGQAKINFAPSNGIAGGQIICVAEEDFSVSANRTGYLKFVTRKDGTLSDRMYLSSQGDLRIGGNSNLGSQLLQVQGGSNSTADVFIANSVASTGQTATLTFGPANNIAGARIIATAEEDFSTGANRTARLEFYTRKDGTLAEKGRFTSDGRLLIGTTTSYGRIHADEIGMLPDGGGWLNAAIVTSGSFGGAVSLLDGSKGYTMFCTEQGDDFFIRGATSTTANVSGGVKLDNRATSWTSASDEREKENLVSITGAIDKIKTLRTVTGNYTWAPDKDYAFLIAQDVQQVLPEAVHVMNKSAAVEDQRLGIAYTQTIPLLTAALKEAIAEIETLKTKVAALEG